MAKVYTKKPMLITMAVRVKDSDLKLLRAAAIREDISQSEFVRLAIRFRARAVKVYGN